jgi:hypothetical protein
MAQSENDKTRYKSIFGDDTVFVQIWIADNSVNVLAHELGHVTY